MSWKMYAEKIIRATHEMIRLIRAIWKTKVLRSPRAIRPMTAANITGAKQFREKDDFHPRVAITSVMTIVPMSAIETIPAPSLFVVRIAETVLHVSAPRMNGTTMANTPESFIIFLEKAESRSTPRTRSESDMATLGGRIGPSVTAPTMEDMIEPAVQSMTFRKKR